MGGDEPRYTESQQHQMEALAQSFQAVNAKAPLPIEDFHEDQV